MDTKQETADKLRGLQIEAAQHFEKIIGEGQVMQAHESSAKDVITHLHQESSVFDGLAQQYATLAWWVKLIVFIATGGVSTGIGYLVGLVVVVPAVVMLVYTVGALFLENHHSTHLKRDEQVNEDVQAIEASVAEAVEQLCDIERQLKSVFTSLYDLNCQQMDTTRSFQEEVDSLEHQVQSLEALVAELESAKRSLEESVHTMNASVELVGASNTLVANQISQLKTSFAERDKTEEAVLAKSEELAALSLEVQRDIDGLEEVIQKTEALTEAIKHSSHHSSSGSAFIDDSERVHQQFVTDINRSREELALRLGLATRRATDTEQLIQEAKACYEHTGHSESQVVNTA